MKFPAEAPDPTMTIQKMTGDPARLQRIMAARVDPAPNGRYLHWDKLRFLDPPKGLTHEEWWFAVKMARTSFLKPLPLLDRRGVPFMICMPEPAQKMVHRIDRDASGKIALSEQVTNPETRDRYIVSSLIDEAITSSQLEGAATTYRVAKQMIRTGRKPKDRSEQMILNNFHAMQHVREMRDKPLTADGVLKLHRILCLDTFDDQGAAGRIRLPEEKIRVFDTRDGTMLHRPPDARELEDRMESMCDFANGKGDKFFLHPVIRAVLLHFWLAYDHPFVDGNGRTARALFYWSMMRSGYWLCEYISISSIVKTAPAKYMRAYLFSETDDNDATYFALFHLEVILKALHALHYHLKKKMAELRRAERFISMSPNLNHRQLALLSHALRHPEVRYSIRSHQTSHGVVYQTARTDLLDLVKRGFLNQEKRGRQFVFSPVSELHKKLESE